MQPKRGTLWVVAALVPLVVVVLGQWTFWELTGRPEQFTRELGPVLLQALLAALPFLVLAGVGAKRDPRRRAAAAAALAGLAATLLLWGLYYYDGYTFWKHPREGGPNLGLSLLMLASPLLVGLVMLGAYRLARRPRSPGREAGARAGDRQR